MRPKRPKQALLARACLLLIVNFSIMTKIISNRQKQLEEKLLNMFHETQDLMSELTDIRYFHDRMHDSEHYSDVAYKLAKLQNSLVELINHEQNIANEFSNIA